VVRQLNIVETIKHFLATQIKVLISEVPAVEVGGHYSHDGSSLHRHGSPPADRHSVPTAAAMPQRPACMSVSGIRRGTPVQDDHVCIQREYTKCFIRTSWRCRSPKMAPGT
jgi:hypothetical protein